MQTKSAIEGALSDPYTGGSKTFNGHVYAGSIPAQTDRNMNFNGGTTEGATLADAGIDWDHIEWLAQNLEDWESGDYKITVLTDGGSEASPLSFTDYMVNPSDTDGGKSLLVFPTGVDVWLDWLSGEYKPGPGILAPFSNVYLKGGAAYQDGYIIANKFATVGSDQDILSLQLHGYPFLGTGYTCTSTESAAPSAAPPTPSVEESGGNGDPHCK